MNTHQLTEEKVAFGVWVYILSDCVLFAALFATYAVQQSQLFGSPGPAQLFNAPFVLFETLLLLTSSFTCGLAVLAMHQHKKSFTLAALGATVLLGATFIGMELYEFRTLLVEGNSWQQSGFLSSFFTLVGTHGLHVCVGLLWILVLISNLLLRGITVGNRRKLLAFSIFWHFLDVIWIFIFTFVYLFGLL